ncbi:hypothetical protein C8J57DRAFT_1651987, partial [Mycena rebaudengoi]
CLSRLALSLSLLPLVFLRSTTTTATRYVATVRLRPPARPALLCAVIAQVSILVYAAFRRRARAPCHLCQNRAGVTKLEIPAARDIQRANHMRAGVCDGAPPCQYMSANGVWCSRATWRHSRTGTAGTRRASSCCRGCSLKPTMCGLRPHRRYIDELLSIHTAVF